MSKSKLSRSIAEINILLAEKFGIPERSKNLPDPLDLLIATILSQNTNDNNSYKAFENLKLNYPDWEMLKSVSEEELEAVIKTAGLAKQKSAAIKNVINTLSETNGKLSLDFLRERSDEKIIEYLTNFNGIGVKTASCVLMFALERNVCPVDTHVHRTLNRIGLVKTSSPDKTFLKINKDFPDGIAHQFHTNLIKLGRKFCKGQKPYCGICPVKELCKFKEKSFLESSAAEKESILLLDKIGDLIPEGNN
ncbi:MAG: endonuclease III [Ignavibacteria bacterium]|nr:endonuclease III [Ignavibacteria bacterium]